MRSVLALVLVATPSLAAAGPITAGVGLGLAHSEANADAEANSTVGLFGRVGFTKRLSAQLELAKIQHDDEAAWGATAMRTGTALLVVDLRDHDRGPWIPVLMVGTGLDRQTSTYSGIAGPVDVVTSGYHIEGGLGLEYRAAGGLTIGADVRMGGRGLDDEYAAQPVGGGIEGRSAAPCGGGGEEGHIGRLPAPAHLSEGEYRSARIALGIRF
jgi:hypothetical protein